MCGRMISGKENEGNDRNGLNVESVDEVESFKPSLVELFYRWNSSRPGFLVIVFLLNSGLRLSENAAEPSS